MFPVAGLCLGYPQGEGHVSLRLPRRLTTHRDRYDDSVLAEAIDDYDRRRDAIHAIPKEQQRANAEFGEGPSTAGRKTRRGRPPRPKARRFRPICVRTASVSIRGDPARGGADLQGRTIPTHQRSRNDHDKVFVRRHQITAPDGCLAGGAAGPADARRPRKPPASTRSRSAALIVATEDDFRPFEFVKDGKPTGFDNELIEDLRKYAPFEIKQEILPWTGILAGVTTGKYDVAITAAIITKERKKSLDFTSPIADATHYYVKRKDDTSISSIKDLNGKTVGVQAGSALLGRLPELGTMLEKEGGKLGKIVEYTSYPEAYQDLALGRVDYVVNTIINLKTLVAEKPKVFEIGQAVSGKSFPAWAVAKDSPELLAFLNEFIAKEKASGRFAELQKKWFGESFPDLPVSFEPEF